MGKNRIYILAVVLGGLLSTPLFAQELNESLTVEGEYVPTIRHQERINVLPEKVSGDFHSVNLNMASQGVPTKTGDDIYAMRHRMA